MVRGPGRSQMVRTACGRPRNGRSAGRARLSVSEDRGRCPDRVGEGPSCAGLRSAEAWASNVVRETQSSGVRSISQPAIRPAMTSPQSVSYPLGGSQPELERLLTQAKAYEPQANWLLDQIGVQPGWRSLDIGCGPIGILNLLSE